MNHRIWFTLVVRAIGVLLIGLSGIYAPSFAQWVLNRVMETWADDRLAAVPGALFWALVEYAGVILQFAFGLYLFLGGKWLIDRCLIDAGAESGNAMPTESSKPV